MRREPPWKKLVFDLQRDGFESPYLDRLVARVNPEQSQRELEKEIVQEMAAALGRAEEKVEVALLELELLERDGADDIAWRAQRERAERALRDLVIHREALGLYRNEMLERLYPIPRRRTAR